MLRTLPLMLFCLLLLPGASAAKADTERLLAEVPEGWVTGLERHTGNLHLVEYFPADTTSTWTEKLSVESLSGEGLPDPLDFVQGWALDQAELCEAFRDNPIFAGFENGYPTVVRMLECGRNKRTGKPLLTMLKVIKGNRSLYTITRIWRLPAQVEAAGDSADTPPPPLPIEQDVVAGWSQALSRVQVCDPALPAHPCPD